jgi:hypothetical protein
MLKHVRINNSVRNRTLCNGTVTGTTSPKCSGTTFAVASRNFEQRVSRAFLIIFWQNQTVKMQNGYELKMRVVEGSVVCLASASQLYHVEIAVDGVQLDEDKTTLVEQIGGKVIWNKQVVKNFKTLETRTPTIITLTLYKKRTFQTGFRLVGSTHIPLMDLARILNKPAVTGKMELYTRSHYVVSSQLVLQVQLRSVDADGPDHLRSPSPTSIATTFSSIPRPPNSVKVERNAEVVRPVASKSAVSLSVQTPVETKARPLDTYVMVALVGISLGVWTAVSVLG